MNTKNTLLRCLPKVDRILAEHPSRHDPAIPGALLKVVVQKTIEDLRRQILQGSLTVLPTAQEEWMALFTKAIDKKMSPNFTRVLNGSGVVIHTNLGRSLLGKSSLAALQTAATCFTNLEFDLASGKRGSRYSLVEDILCDLTGAEAAIVVNNNAAAVLLSLNTLSFNKECIVSRGQLVEIGGSFRIPDVMSRSGATMVEVGATNRTHLRDYEAVLHCETGLLLKVHTSNFRVIGFTSEVPVGDLVRLGQGLGVPVMEDLGSGSLIDLSPWGLPKEPTVQEIVKAGVDVVTFSGDKLLGGPQAGIIVGKKDIIARIKENPMNRALRIDKFTLASLETVLREYYDLEQALVAVPTLAMLTIAPDLIKSKGQRLLCRLGEQGEIQGKITLKETVSKVGGGAMPEYDLASWALVLQPGKRGASSLERWLRGRAIPLIGRIEEEQIIIDLRTVLDHDLPVLLEVLEQYLALESLN